MLYEELVAFPRQVSRAEIERKGGKLGRKRLKGRKVGRAEMEDGEEWRRRD